MADQIFGLRCFQKENAKKYKATSQASMYLD